MIAKEIERVGIPVGLITPMFSMAKQQRVNRIIMGVRIPNPCGDPDLSEEADLALRREIVRTALRAIQTDVSGITVFDVPQIMSLSA